MAQLLIALDRGVEVRPAELVAAWNADDEAQVAGTARAEAVGGSDFFPGVVELVVIPLLVNVGSGAVYDVLKTLLSKLHPDRHGRRPELEITEVMTRDGDRVIVVRTGAAAS